MYVETSYKTQEQTKGTKNKSDNKLLRAEKVPKIHSFLGYTGKSQGKIKQETKKKQKQYVKGTLKTKIKSGTPSSGKFL